MPLIVFMILTASSVHDFDGVWKLDAPANDRGVRGAALENATAVLNRPASLTENAVPSAELRLAVVGEQVMLARQGRSLTLRLGAAPRRIWSEHGRDELAIRFRDGRLWLTSRGEHTERVSTFSLSEDGQRLTWSVRISQPSAAAPVEYASTFVRVAP